MDRPYCGAVGHAARRSAHASSSAPGTSAERPRGVWLRAGSAAVRAGGQSPSFGDLRRRRRRLLAGCGRRLAGREPLTCECCPRELQDPIDRLRTRRMIMASLDSKDLRDAINAVAPLLKLED